MTPQRIQRKRTKGWRAPEGAVYVGRGTKWGNPFAVSKGKDVNGAPEAYLTTLTVGTVTVRDMPGSSPPAVRATLMAVELFKKQVAPNLGSLEELRGKDLMCWCAEDLPCHADVLLELANEEQA